MFEDLEDNPLIMSFGSDSDGDLAKVKKELTDLSPDFVEFVKKFGRVDVDDGYFTIYSWIEDMAYYFSTMDLPIPEVDAWVFGDGDGDFAGIDKNTGKIIQVSSENSKSYENTHENFEEFIRNMLEDE